MTHWKDHLDPQSRGGRFLPWKEVARATGLSRTTAWRLQKRGEFPAPYAISPGRVGFLEDEVEAWRVSRDHSAARAERPSAAQPLRPIPQASTILRPPSVPDGSPEAASLTPLPSTRSKTASGRRSQHAKAVAQQILFDF